MLTATAEVLAGRSLAACVVFGCDRASVDCLGCWPLAERTQRKLASSSADAEWSVAAAKLPSQCRSPASRSVAAEQCGNLAQARAAQVSAL